MNVQLSIQTKKLTRMASRPSGRRVTRKINQLLKNYSLKNPQLVTHKGFN